MTWDPKKHPRIPGGPGGGEFKGLEHLLGDGDTGYVGRRRAADDQHSYGTAPRSMWVQSASDKIGTGRGEHTPVRGTDRLREIEAARPRNTDPAPGGRQIGVVLSDPALGDIMHAQGFDGAPEVLTPEQMDVAVRGGQVTELFRALRPHDGHTGADFAEQYRSGDMYAGTGIYGNGAYTTPSWKEADGMAREPGSQVMRMGLRSDARVISYDDAKAAARKHGSRRNLWFDPGRAAAALGYDAILVPPGVHRGSHSYYVILNRTATVVEAG